MRGVRPRGGRQGVVVPDALPCPPRQVGSGVPRIAVEAQVVGADGVPDDQARRSGHAAGRRQSGHRAVFPDRLPARREGRQDAQQAEERRQARIATAASPGHGPRPRRRSAGPARRPGAGCRRRTAAASAGPPRSPASRTATTPRAARRVLGRSRFTAATTTPGISSRTAWPTGTVQGNPSPLRKYPS